MLHIKHPTKIINGRRYSHTAAFRRDERDFDFFEQSERWIRDHFGQVTKKKGKSFFRRLFD
jgi:Zn-finger nucleic acid-binding protein